VTNQILFAPLPSFNYFLEALSAFISLASDYAIMSETKARGVWNISGIVGTDEFHRCQV
jgi:hypothetical protein